jgi:hypothetical protein
MYIKYTIPATTPTSYYCYQSNTTYKDNPRLLDWIGLFIITIILFIHTTDQLSTPTLPADSLVYLYLKNTLDIGYC